MKKEKGQTQQLPMELQQDLQSKQPPLQVIELKERSKIIITKELLARIYWLHSHVKRSEWSGLLICSINEGGTISNPQSLVIKALDIHLMDIGTAAFTAYDFDHETFFDLLDHKPEYLGLKIGMIHTHHAMNTFFSDTDKEDLEDGARSNNYYVSLIANFEGDFSGKLSYLAKSVNKNIITSRSDDGKSEVTKEFITEKEVLVVVNCDIHFEESDFFINRYNFLLDQRIAKDKARTVLNPSVSDAHDYDDVNLINNFNSIDDQSVPDKMIYKFLADLIAIDPNNKDSLIDVLENQSKVYSSGDALNVFCYTVIQHFDDFSILHFAEDNYSSKQIDEASIRILNKTMKLGKSMISTKAKNIVIKLVKILEKNLEYA